MFDLLAQAEADHAFRDFENIDQLFALEATTDELRPIYWKNSVLDKYVLRNSDGAPMKAQNLNNFISQYAKEEGYERLTSYAIRRYVSNTLASK
jgi:hypothetical protein